MAVMKLGIVNVSLGLLLAAAYAHSSLNSRPGVISRQFHDDLNSQMNATEAPAVESVASSPMAAQLPNEFELFDPPNLYVYHDYVSQGLPKFMTDVELSTGAQRMVFILHWSVRYFLVILLVLGMLQ
ncbi:Hypothetical protein NTJ_11062 [Nesidiocoris tenuis]|uniref:Uncharacterized protein n=1 Tax=Nesidiocoris tenuis TaxID=355587 RepID=A0ABN7B1E9_9HEMI|nr:Hypothetical protein NTJ_11062 [Nesidiocoris tenuis]